MDEISQSLQQRTEAIIKAAGEALDSVERLVLSHMPARTRSGRKPKGGSFAPYAPSYKKSGMRDLEDTGSMLSDLGVTRESELKRVVRLDSQRNAIVGNVHQWGSTGKPHKVRGHTRDGRPVAGYTRAGNTPQSRWFGVDKSTREQAVDIVMDKLNISQRGIRSTFHRKININF